jgi:hypothetical protein
MLSECVGIASQQARKESARCVQYVLVVIDSNAAGETVISGEYQHMACTLTSTCTTCCTQHSGMSVQLKLSCKSGAL